MQRFPAILIATFVVAVLQFTSVSYAYELKASKQTCTTPDCGATELGGRINKSDRCCGFANQSMPWVTHVYVNKKECLWLHVTAQDTDTELVAIAPGTMRAWRNDSSKVKPCTKCPLLKIKTSNNEEGWFLVQVNQAAGSPIDAEFTLKYARYASNNPNCSSPSQPLPAP